MGTLNDIRQKLLSGGTVSQLIKEGYAKSSVNHVARKLKKTQPAGTPASSVEDELQELRHQKEVVKLKKEISELEAAKEKVPDRVAKLEAEVQWLNQQLPDLLANCIACLYVVILVKHGWNQDEAVEEATIVGKDLIEDLWPQH